jgi:6-phospho-beta-glucosidase
MKVALIGGGGSRTPVLYRGLSERRGRLPVSELVLHDTDALALGRVVKVLEGLDAEGDGGVPFRTTTVLEDALEGASFVLTAIRAGGFEGRVLDETIPLQQGAIGQETVGAGGFALAVRNVPAVRAVGEAVLRSCPAAWLVNLTNPAGMVTEALLPLLGDRVVGVCDSPLAIGRRVAGTLGVDVSSLHLEYGGLNHLGWLSAAWLDGRDVLPALLADPAADAIEEVQLFGREALRPDGCIPNEYLYFYERTAEVLANVGDGSDLRGAYLLEEQRQLAARIDEAGTPAEALHAYRRSLGARNDSYMAVEAGVERGNGSDAFAAAGGYHDMALSVLEAIAADEPAVHIVNTRNRGALPFLAEDDVVEVPAVVRAAGVFPLAARVPESRQALVERVKRYERATLAAIEAGSLPGARAALALHPLVPEHAVDRILAGYVERIPAFAAQLAGR